MAKKSVTLGEGVEAVQVSVPVEVIRPALEHDYSRSGMVNPLYSVDIDEFTGVVRSMRCINNQGHSNFQILTMYVEKGKIVKVEVSDPYVVWEAISKMTHWNELSALNLNSNWKEGRVLTK